MPKKGGQYHHLSGVRAGTTPIKPLRSAQPRKRGRAPANIEARRFWHQGFGTIKHQGLNVVPFCREETARRIADQAARELEIVTIVFPIGELWAYREED
jgi:hypothetical protein